jgi:formate dehydrogenase major subunit
MWHDEDRSRSIRTTPRSAASATATWVGIASRAGETVLRARITERMQPGVVYTTFHFPESGANVITTEFSDWATNCPEYKVTAVQVMDMNRRQFFRVSGAGLVGSSLVALGFSPTAALAETRNFKLARTTETRSTCPYCSVSCGLIMYTLGDKAKNVKSTIIHIEGDPDHPVNRGTLCPKGAGVMDMIQSKDRVKVPQVREAGSNEWKQIAWDEALTRVAKHMKADRDANLVKSVEKDGKSITVNRWNTSAFLVSSASSNESGYLSVKVARGLGMVALDTQARI